MLDNNVVSIERFFNRIDESQTVEPRVIERLGRYSRNVFSSSGVGEEFEKDVWDVCNLIRVFRGVNGKKCNIYFGGNAGVDTLKTLCALYIINSKSKSTGNIQRHCKSIIDLSMEVDLSEVSHERFLQNYNIKMNEMQGRGLSLSSLRRFHLSAKLTLDYLCGRAIGTKSHKENRNSCNERYIINPNLVYVDLSPLKKKFEVTAHISGNVRKGSMDLLRRTRDLMISVDDLISAYLSLTSEPATCPSK